MSSISLRDSPGPPHALLSPPLPVHWTFMTFIPRCFFLFLFSFSRFYSLFFFVSAYVSPRGCGSRGWSDLIIDCRGVGHGRRLP